MGEDCLKKLMVAALVLCCMALVLEIATHTNQFQWDFRAYYYAAKAYAAGQNPYDTRVLSRTAGTPIRLPYTYPPATLFFFRLFASTDYTTAYYGFLGLKCIFLIGLLYVWKAGFLPVDRTLLFYPFCLFAYNGAIYLDMRAGNITVLEQAFVWLALLLFLKDRRAPFCLFVIVAAAFRITPILFLGALFLCKGKKKYLYFSSSAVLYVCTLGTSYATQPGMFSQFLSTSLRLDERGVQNPSTLPLIRDVLHLLETRTGIGMPPGTDLILYSAIVLVLLFVTWRAFVVLRSTHAKDRERMELFMLCLVYALLLPRFKDYSYILLIVPTYFILTRVRSAKVYPFLLVLASVPSRLLASDGFPKGFRIFWEYYPLAVAYAVWALYVYDIFSRKAVTNTRGI